ncbi:uncharacterized protein BT62DRAFT_190673 [Guyanagaster necrorhizus]|uniref:Uncharacterized protein n=1 Tax=Guyanagaster necrorhizus TaxID=856835 RepID=A0A9P7VSV8_9AGAR|nr:uncharacterized protein BT62DRAFT_190673 [Guyanagaster necrorhizus MCA 3950]KAG7445346.1 hypothetical protein BT62DRAFT_190673 [Guyanagaster necrorhizus MCA 3950]
MAHNRISGSISRHFPTWYVNWLLAATFRVLGICAGDIPFHLVDIHDSSSRLAYCGSVDASAHTFLLKGGAPSAELFRLIRYQTVCSDFERY